MYVTKNNFLNAEKEEKERESVQYKCKWPAQRHVERKKKENEFKRRIKNNFEQLLKNIHENKEK